LNTKFLFIYLSKFLFYQPQFLNIGSVRIKNGFDATSTEKAKEFHLRVFMMNLLYSPGLTYGKLATESKEIWDKYLRSPPENPSISWFTWRSQAQAAVDHLRSAVLCNTPVKLIVESQVLLDTYKAARGEMHFLYKIVRADSDIVLYKQFAKKPTDVLKKKKTAEKVENNTSRESAEQEALDMLILTMKETPSIQQSEEELCVLLRNNSVNGWKRCVEKIVTTWNENSNDSARPLHALLDAKQ
tara:strand:- start:75 stop:803 length:729 start_codon:yes stop_codon:yes gene_type:complete